MAPSSTQLISENERFSYEKELAFAQSQANFWQSSGYYGWAKDYNNYVESLKLAWKNQSQGRGGANKWNSIGRPSTTNNEYQRQKTKKRNEMYMGVSGLTRGETRIHKANHLTPEEEYEAKMEKINRRREQKIASLYDDSTADIILGRQQNYVV